MSFCTDKFRGLLFASSISLVVEYLTTLAGTIIAGNVLGEQALGGYNLVSSPQSLLIFVSQLIALGTSILYSSAMGRFEEKRASQLFSGGLLASLGAGVVLAVIFCLSRTPFLNFMDADQETLTFAGDYWNWFLLFALVHPVTLFLMSMVYCDGDNAICMSCYPTKLVLGTIVSLVLCKVMGLGGCAIGSTVGDLGALVVLCLHFLKKSNSLKFSLFFSWRDLLNVAKSAFGDASVMLCWAILYFVLNKFCISSFGADKLPIVAAVIAAIGFTQIFDGIGNAIQPLIGVYAGEKNYRCIRSVMGAAGWTSLIEGSLLMLFLLLWPQAVLKIVGIKDASIIQPACSAIRIMGISMVFWAFVFLFNSYYLFIAQELLACLLTALKDLVCPITLYLLCGKIWGFPGVWIGYAAAAPIAILIFSLFLLFKFGKDKFPLLLPRERDKQTYIWDLHLDVVRICGVSAEVGSVLKQAGKTDQLCGRVSLLTEEVLMAIRDHNHGRTVLAEITLDLNDGLSLVMRDDGDIFDITDCNARISSLRTYLVSSLMEHQKERKNLTTTGFNRNAFKF